jgi:RNA polymerase sigma-70 factor (ECF subfamily)
VALRQEEFTSLCDDVDLDRDRALVERCQAGDSAAFGNLYARYYERLLRFCLRRLNDRHEAEDAAQEAFARAWKALPNFAGERRFYPWLTVIAGNICTDMLRRRSRSTPTEDIELSARQPMTGSGAETSEELVLAAVDGELVNRALGRLSTRHRHVLAMREGSGWTYQQIADHEGVEIGTIETLLWRARQALKREFTVLSESKGALAGFLAGTGAVIRRATLRAANKTAFLQWNGSGGLRNAVAGVAVTSAAVAAAIITPHVLATPHHANQAQAAPSGSALADPPLPIATSATAPGLSSLPVVSGDLATIESPQSALDFETSPATPLNATVLHASVPSATSPSATTPATSDGGPTASSPVTAGPDLPTPGVLAPVVTGLGQVTTSLGNTVGSLSNTVGSLATTLGLTQVLSGLGLVGTPGTSSSTTSPSGTSTPTTTIPPLVNSVTKIVGDTLKSVLGAK